MPSTYTLNNGIELIGTGEQSGTWGDTTNTNLELLDTALDGQVTITAASAGSSGSPNSLPISDGSASNGRNRMVIITSATDLGSTVYYQLTPNDAEKIIYIRNDLNAQDLIVFQGTYNSSNDYVVPNGTTAVIYFNGAGAGAVAANVFNNAHFDNLNIVGDVTIGDDLTLNSDGAIINIGADADLQITHSGSAGTITNATGDLTLDVAGDIILDADGADVKFRDGGAGFFTITNSSLDAVLKVEQSNEDFIIKGNDGGVEITALTLDMSEAGAATFNVGGVFNESGANSDFRIESTNSTHMLFVDASEDAIGIRKNDPTYGLDVGVPMRVITADNSTQLTLESTDADASGGPIFTLYRNSSSPAANDFIGKVRFEGRNNNSQSFIAAEILTKIQDVADGAEDGDLRIYTMGNGTSRNRLAFYTDKTVFNDDSIDADFRVESDGNANMLFVDAGTDVVDISSTAAAYDTDTKLQVAGRVRFGSGFGAETAGMTTPTNSMILTKESFSPTSGATRIYGLSAQNSGYSPSGDTAPMAVLLGGWSAGSSRAGGIEYEPATKNLYIMAGTTGASQQAFSDTGRVASFNSSSIVFNDQGNNQDFRVESDSNANMLVVNAGTNRIGMGTSNPTGSLHLLDVTDNSGADVFYVAQNTTSNRVAGYRVFDESSNVTAVLQYDNGSNTSILNLAPPSVGNADIRFDGTTFEISSNSSSAKLQLQSNSTDRLTFYATGAAVFNEPGDNYDFRVESDSNTHAIFLDSGFNSGKGGVGIAKETPQALLHVGGVGDSAKIGRITSTIEGGGAANHNWYKICDLDFSGSSTFNQNALHVQIVAAGGTSGEDAHMEFHVFSKQQGTTDRWTLKPWRKHGMDLAYKWDTSGGGGSSGRLELWIAAEGVNYQVFDVFVRDLNPNPANNANLGAWQFTDTGSETAPAGSTTVVFPLTGHQTRYTQSGLQNSQFVINEDSDDIDFRVESDSHTHCLFLDAGTNAIGINYSAPGVNKSFAGTGVTSNFHVNSDSSTNGPFFQYAGAGIFVGLQNDVGSGTRYYLTFGDSGSGRFGDVTSNGSTMTYGGTSDYRLKTNVQPMSGSISRVKQLNPVTFDWISSGISTEGFLAHEVQSVVADAATGVKDEVDENGNPVYQQVDPRHVVPLLTSALQEAITKIEQLEARIAALETP